MSNTNVYVGVIVATAASLLVSLVATWPTSSIAAPVGSAHASDTIAGPSAEQPATQYYSSGTGTAASATVAGCGFGEPPRDAEEPPKETVSSLMQAGCHEQCESVDSSDSCVDPRSALALIPGWYIDLWYTLGCHTQLEYPCKLGEKWVCCGTA